MSALWSPSQREWLRALGHPVLMLSGDERALDEAVAVDAGDRGRGDAVEAESPPEPTRLRVPEPPMRPVLVDIPDTAAPVAAGSVPDRMGDRLYRALLRATARRTPREGEAMLQAMTFDLDALRADPAGKRVLWAQLRTARKAARG